MIIVSLFVNFRRRNENLWKIEDFARGDSKKLGLINF